MGRPILISSPGRCGTHWLARILRRLTGYRQEKTYRWNDPEMIAWAEDPPEDTIFVTHDPLVYFTPWQWDDRIESVVMVRDPRDITVSAAYYWYSKIKQGKLEDLKKLRVYWEAKIPDDADFDTILDTLKYCLHNRRWFFMHHQYRSHLPCFVVKYEELHRRPIFTIKELLSYLDMYKYSSEIEPVMSKAGNFEIVSGGRKMGEEDPDHFYRKGIVGDWKNHFTLQENEDFWERHKMYMQMFGYYWYL